MPGRNKDADVENRLVDTVGKGGGGMHSESSTAMHILPYVKQIAQSCCITQEFNPAFCDDTEERDGGAVGGRLMKEGLYIVMTDSHCCMAETHTTL